MKKVTWLGLVMAAAMSMPSAAAFGLTITGDTTVDRISDLSEGIYMRGGTVSIDTSGGDVTSSKSIFINGVNAAAVMTLNGNNYLIVNKDFEIQGSGHKTEFIMKNNSNLKVSSPGYGINIGTQYDNGGSSTSSFIIDEDATASIYAERYFALKAEGEFVAKRGSTTTLDMNHTGPANTLGHVVLGSGDGGPMLLDENGVPLPEDNATPGGLFKMEADSQMIINGGGFFLGQYGHVDMATGSELSLNGKLYIYGGTADFAKLTVRSYGTDLPDGLSMTGGTVNFNDDVEIQSASLFIDSGYKFGQSASVVPLDSIVTLAAGKSITVGSDFEVQASNGALTRFIMQAGSEIISTGAGHGFNIGTNYDGGGDGISQFIVAANNAGTGVTLKADRFFGVYGQGQFLVEDNSSAEITLNKTGSANTHGYLFMGGGENDLGIVDENGVPFEGSGDSGGLLKIGRNSTLAISGGGAVFGQGSTVDVGLGKLEIDGDAYYKAGSSYQVGFTENAAGKTVVSGQVSVEDGAKIKLYDANSAEKQAGPVVVGKTVLSAGSFANDTVFKNTLYSLKIDDQNNMVVDKYLGSKQVIEGMLSSAGSSMTKNYANAAVLIDAVIQSDNASAELQSVLGANMETLAEMGENGDPASELALKQLIGEEALGTVNATVDTLERMNSALDGRLNTLRDFSAAPSAGYGQTLNRVWLGGFGTWSRQDNRGRIYGYDYDAGGLMLGYDREVESAPGLTLGLSGAWSDGTLKNKSGLAETDIDTFSLGLYGSYDFRNGFFVDGNLSYGHSSNDSTIKLVVGGKKSSSFDSDSWQAGLNFGYTRYLSDNTRLIPSVGLQYIHIKQDGWREKIVSNPNNLAVANWFGDSKHNFLEIPLKLRLNSSIETDSGLTLTPELRIGGIFTADKPKSELRMGFAGSGDSANIYGIDPGRNRFQAGAGLKAQLSDNIDIRINYDFEGRSGYKAHNLNGGLGFSF